MLATLLLGASLGPEVQGTFSRTKAELEFVAALAMFGLPQSLFFHVKSGRMSDSEALRWALLSGLFALLIGAVLGLQKRDQGGVTLVFVVGLAIGACVVHGQLRVLLLVRERTEWFNVFTALPQLIVFAGVLIVVAGVSRASPTPMTWWLVFSVSFGIAAALAWAKLRSSSLETMLAPLVDWRAVARYGLATWLVAAMSTAAILFAQQWVQASAGLAALGRFTLAFALVQIPLTPVTYAAPLLFRRWMERPGAAASQRWAAKLFLILLGAAAIVWWLAPFWPDLGLGSAYSGVTRAFGVLLVGGAAEAASRILAAQTIAGGMPWVGVRAEAARWCVLGISWLLPFQPSLLVLCVVWASAAMLAALVFAVHVRTADSGRML